MSLVGRKGSGKTQLCLKLLLEPLRGVFDRIIIISPTFQAQFAQVWCKLDPKGVTVYEQVTEKLLLGILREQAEEGACKLLLISDDNGEDWKHVSPILVNKLISNSRHLHISCLFLAQKMTQLPTIVRANSDVFCVFQATSWLEQTALFNEVATCDRRSFDLMFHSATKEQYSFLVASVIEGRLRFYRSFLDEIKVA